MRAVVDAGVWVSARLNPKGYPARILEAYWNGLFSLVTCAETLAEVSDVLSRPRIAKRYGINGDDVRTFADLLREGAEVVPVQGRIQVGRDTDDNPVVEAAVARRIAS